MADKKITTVVDVQTKQAQQNVEKLNKKLDQTEQKIEEVNQESRKAASGVEGWGTAFEVAFDTADQAAGGLGGSLKELVDNTRGAIPVVKNLSSTALKGLSGIKGAIAATGIGALVVAIGLIASHWEGFTHAVGLSSDKFKEFKETAMNALQNVVSGVTSVGNVILQGLLTPVRVAIEAFKGLGNVIKDIFTGNWKEIKTDAEAALSGMGTAVLKAIDLKGNFEKGKEAGKKFMDGVVTTFTYEKEDVTDAAGEVGTEAGEELKNKALEEAKKFVSELKKTLDPANKIVSGLFDEKVFGNRVEAILAHYKDLSRETAEAIAKVWTEANDDVVTLNTAIQELESSLGDLDIKRSEATGEEAEVYEQAYQDALASLENYRQAKEEIIASAEQQELDLVVEFQKKKEEEIKAANEEAIQKEQDAQQEAAEKEKAILESRLSNFLAFADSISWIIDSMVEAETAQVEKELALGKITQKEAEERFEQLKGWQIASTWINVLAGVTSALSSPVLQSAGPVGWALAALQSAALLAEGVASTRQIANTEFGQGGEGGSVETTVSAGATPIQVVEDITPTATMNVPVSSEDTRVYILESDIQKSNNRVKIRESNTSF